MTILSFDFFYFVLCTLAIYYVLPKKFQNLFLLLASYYFYSTWRVNYLYFLAGITTFNYLYAKLLHRDEGRRQAPLWLGIVINLSLYSILLFNDFFQIQANNLLGRLGTQGITIELLLPIGFSYYVLESISYLVDVKRKQLKASTDLVNFSLYLVYFPKLLSGPIERAPGFLKKLTEEKTIGNKTAAKGITLILIGLARTLIFADILIIIFPITVFNDPLSHSNPDLAIWMIVFGIVLYNQFAGYSNIVRGVSALYGIELSMNFAQPIFSQNFSELWTRWHISLSAWLRDYIYLPLSRRLLRKNPSRRNIANRVIPPMVTMLASGIWHGASINLMLWGAIMGIYMVVEQLISMFQTLDPSRKRPLWRKLVSSGFVTGFGFLAMIPFRLDMPSAKVYLYGIIKADNWQFPTLIPLIYVSAPILLDYLQYRSGDEYLFLKWPRWIQSLLIGLVILAIFIVDAIQLTYLPFVYP